MVTRPKTVTHPGTNRARRRVTTLIDQVQRVTITPRRHLRRGLGWAGPQPRPLLAVPNVTECPSTASVPITVLLYSAFNVPIKSSQVVPVKALKFHTRKAFLVGEVFGGHELFGQCSLADTVATK